MFRSSVAAFYPLPRFLFYRVGGFHWSGFIIVFLRPSVLCEVKKIVDRVSEILFAAEIAFRRLKPMRDPARTESALVHRRESWQSFRAGSTIMPHAA